MTGGAAELYEGPLFAPRYRPLVSGSWRLDVVPVGHAPGYWSGPSIVSDMAVLTRESESWMSMTPLEVESQEIGIRSAAGRVLVFGLGMGWAPAACASLHAVTHVTVVERDPEVIELHRRLDLFSQLPQEARAKLEIVEGDAFDYVPRERVDLLMPDIWRPLVEGDRVEEVRRMQRNVSAAAIYFWGQELEIARRAAAAARLPDEAGIAATIAETGLPLIGADYPDYPAKVAAAAARWMRGRWTGQAAQDPAAEAIG